MKTLYLVGKALPEFKEAKKTPFPSGELTDLVALDPRHGVFPNLVMTPLFATVMAFYEEGDVKRTIAMLDQSKEILQDHSPRRFNALSKPVGENRQLHPAIPQRLDQLDPERDVWIVFKHSTAFALIAYLCTGETEFTEESLNAFGMAFLTAASESPGCTFGVPKLLNTQVGMLFKLLAGEDVDGDGVVGHLRYAVQRMAPNINCEDAVKVLRSFVPLLHNDAYDKSVVGLIQNRFMAGEDLRPNHPDEADPTPDLYWRFIGRAIKRRMLTRTVPCP